MVTEGGLVDPNRGIEQLTYRGGKGSDHWGYVVQPRIVVTIDAQGVIADSEGSFTLRNARFLQIRENKPVEEIASYNEIRSAYFAERS